QLEEGEAGEARPHGADERAPGGAHRLRLQLVLRCAKSGLFRYEITVSTRFPCCAAGVCCQICTNESSLGAMVSSLRPAKARNSCRAMQACTVGLAARAAASALLSA